MSFSNEPTYVNETQLLYYDNDIINVYPRPELHYNNVSREERIRRLISRTDEQWSRYRAHKENNAAIIIQRAFRLFRLQKQRNQMQNDFDEPNNYIQFWDEYKTNNRNGNETTNRDLLQYLEARACNSIPSDNSSHSTPDLPNKRVHNHESPPPLQHHAQCPLSRQRNHSIDFIRFKHSDMLTHQRIDQPFSPHSVLIYEEDLRRINPNLYVVRTCDQPPLVMAVNSTCPTHKLYQHTTLNPRIVPVDRNFKPHDNGSQSKCLDESPRFNSLKKQSKTIQNQKLNTNKRLYRIGLNVFNKNPIAGINFLLKYQFVKSHPSYIANFLLTKSGISRGAIGDYLGSISDSMALQVTKFFLRRINMRNKEVDEALRSFIYYVHLPGESQQISHLMEEFQKAYLQQNSSRPMFNSNDTVMVLAYAIIMLQTDAHNNSIRKNEKMTLEQFITNLRGVDDKADIDRVILEQIYGRVTSKEFKTQPDYTDQVRRLNEVICGSNKPLDLVNRIRRFVCYCRMSEIKEGSKKNKLVAHQREVFLFNDLLLINKVHNKSRKDDTQYQCKYAFALTGLRMKPYNDVDSIFGVQLFDRKTNEFLIKLNARCEQDQRKFMFDLSEYIYESLEMASINYGDYLTPSHNNDNSKFISGNISSLPNPPQRRESLAKDDCLNYVHTLHKHRQQVFTEKNKSDLLDCTVKSPLNCFYK